METMRARAAVAPTMPITINATNGTRVPVNVSVKGTNCDAMAADSRRGEGAEAGAEDEHDQRLADVHP